MKNQITKKKIIFASILGSVVTLQLGAFSVTLQTLASGITELSGGQKKLASIATILSTEPEILLFDEPSAALDPKNRRNLIHVMNGLNGTKDILSDKDLLERNGLELPLSLSRSVSVSKEQ